MQFLYNNNTLDNATITRVLLENKVNVSTARKNFGMVTHNNKLYFIKTINKSAPPTLVTNPNNDKEIDPTKQVVKYLDDNQNHNDFFVTINCICQNDKYDHYVMDYVKYGDFNNVLTFLSSKWKYSLLLQSLLGIFILNHKIKLFHNDLCYINQIRNIMVDHVPKPYTIDITLNNTNIVLHVKKLAAKVIDFGRSADKQTFRTTQYHTQYFQKIKYISEPLVFTLFFFKTLGTDEHNYLMQLALEIARISTSLSDFDSRFIIKIYNKYRKYV